MIRMSKCSDKGMRKYMLSASVILLGIILFLCIKFEIKPIHAYLKDTDRAVNTMVIGNNKISVEELFEEPVRGEKTVKEPKVKNVGSVDCYVRGKILLSDSRAERYVELYNQETTGVNTKDWRRSSEGWFYYIHVLKAGELSAPMFTHMKLGEGMPDLFQGITVDVIFESVQTDGFSTPEEAFKALDAEEKIL